MCDSRDVGSLRAVGVVLLSLLCVNAAHGQRQMERLNRGLVAVPSGDAEHFVSWRLLGTDPENAAFNLYRRVPGGRGELVNRHPITAATNWAVPVEPGRNHVEYSVRLVVEGKEREASSFVGVWSGGCLEIPMQPIKGYTPGDASVADLDGDGAYEIVVQQNGRTHDNSHSGLTDACFLEAYELGGSRLWRIDLGRNIRNGEHYTQFMVYDLDGDGRAEVVCKTADGTIDGTGHAIGDAVRDWRDLDKRSRAFGRILDGPEFLTVFDGRSGAALHTANYVPDRYPIDGWGGIGGNGGNDSYGNRCDRFLACVAYLDGERPNLVACRGVYGRSVLAAWDWRDGKLTQRWVFDSGISYPPYRDASPYSGMGGHSLAVADVDGDGRDEIVYHAMVVDDDGRGLYTTGWRHGDALHVADMYPRRPGIEIFTVHENEGPTVRFRTPGAAMRDGRTGELLWSHSPGVDVGAGLAADIDPRNPGFEAWGGPGGLRGQRGESIGTAPRTTRFAIWWDGDLLRELFSGSRVTKWNWRMQQEEVIEDFDARLAKYPCLVADLVGDWREEVLLPSPDGQALRLYTTAIPTQHRIHCLMHDPQYRLGITWQNVVYNQPANTSFYLGDGMESPPRPHIRVTGGE